MNTELICTLGPASLNAECISELTRLGVGLFRLNLSHTELEQIPTLIDLIRANSAVPICFDSEGAQVRTGSMVAAVALQQGAIVRVTGEAALGTSQQFSLTPPDALQQLALGDILSLDFDGVTAEVVAKDVGSASLRILSGGTVGSNKGVAVEREIRLPAISPKDKAALLMGRDLGIHHFALSFASCAADVDQMRALAGKDTILISKIESRRGVLNLDAIALRSDAILIDRGDLSREVPIERIPAAQKHILTRAVQLNRKCYVATNLLESMIGTPLPTRAEVNDIWNTLKDGASGLVLAAETAIGRHPTECAAMIKRIAEEFEQRPTFSIDGDIGPHKAPRIAEPEDVLRAI